MKSHGLKGIGRLRAAWANSSRGFRDIWRHEEAFRIEVIATLVSIPAAFVFAQSALHAALLISAMLLLLIVEILNSAIEAVVDRIGPEIHDLSRMAKDLGSLAVLLATVIPAVLWVMAIVGWLARG